MINYSSDFRVHTSDYHRACKRAYPRTRGSTAFSRRLWSISAIAFSALLPSALAAQNDTIKAIVNGELGRRADSAVQSLVARGMSGVVLIAKNGTVLLKKGYGEANRAAKTPMTANTVVQIGSNTKDFTTVSILQLNERGQLNLDDSISKYFPEAPADKRGITIRQLIRHRGGFPQNIGGDFEALSKTQWLSRAFSTKLLFAPGDSMSYSNTGFSILAAIIERVSGTSYDEYVQSHILAPLHLVSTGTVLPHFDLTRVAHGYRDGTDNGTIIEKAHAVDGFYWNLRGNGGMLSTVSEMYLFYRALFSSAALIKAETRELVFGPREPRMLAGSDGVSFFLYNTEPQDGYEILIATTSGEFKGQRVSVCAPAAGCTSVAPQRPINILDLMTHTSGLPVYLSIR